MFQFLIEPFAGRQHLRGNDDSAMQASGIALLCCKPECNFGLPLFNLEIGEDVAQKLLGLLGRYLPSMDCPLVGGCLLAVVKMDGASPSPLQPIEDGRLNLGNADEQVVINGDLGWLAALLPDADRAFPVKKTSGIGYSDSVHSYSIAGIGKHIKHAAAWMVSQGREGEWTCWGR